MKEPEKIPLNPQSPRAKSVPLIKMPPVDNIKPDNDSVYIQIDNNEDSKESHKTEL